MYISHVYIISFTLSTGRDIESKVIVVPNIICIIYMKIHQILTIAIFVIIYCDDNICRM